LSVKGTGRDLENLDRIIECMEDDIRKLKMRRNDALISEVRIRVDGNHLKCACMELPLNNCDEFENQLQIKI